MDKASAQLTEKPMSVDEIYDKAVAEARAQLKAKPFKSKKKKNPHPTKFLTIDHEEDGALPPDPVREAHRPSGYTEELSQLICKYIMMGYTARSIGMLKDMPDRETIRWWLINNSEFRGRYMQARRFRANSMAEEILDIADNSSNDWMETFAKAGGKATGWELNGDHVRRAHLRVEARKWLMSKELWRIYGDKLTVEAAPIDLRSLDRDSSVMMQSLLEHLATKAKPD